MYRVYKVAEPESVLLFVAYERTIAYDFCQQHRWKYRDDRHDFEWDLEIEPDDREMID